MKSRRAFMLNMAMGATGALMLDHSARAAQRGAPAPLSMRNDGEYDKVDLAKPDICGHELVSGNNGAGLRGADSRHDHTGGQTKHHVW